MPEVGRSTAVLIALVPALYRKALISAASERAVILDTTQRCGDYFRALFAAQAREVFYQACLDGKGKLLNLYRISEGDVSSVTLNIRTIAENAIRANAVQVVLAHNHPSGIALPSEDDVNTRTWSGCWTPWVSVWRTTSSRRTATSCPCETRVTSLRRYFPCRNFK